VILPSPDFCRDKRDWYTDLAELMADVAPELGAEARAAVAKLYQEAKDEAEQWDNLANPPDN
jgi:hypothetical protein